MYISQNINSCKYITGVQRLYFRGIYVVVHLNIMVLRFFAQLPIYFPGLLCLTLNSIFHLILWFKIAFNPTLSLWWEGIFERMVKLVKTCLKKILLGVKIAC